jgi:hypothetical protein
MNSSDIETGTVLGAREGSAAPVSTAEKGVPCSRLEETGPHSLPVNGEVPEEQPGELQWSKARHKVRVAAAKYSEDTHADY